MRSGVSALERAFEMARSGLVPDVPHIKRALDKEGYFSNEIDGPKLRKQLQSLIEAALHHGAAPAAGGDLNGSNDE